MFLIKPALKTIVVLFASIFLVSTVQAQIIVNGPNPSRYQRGSSKSTQALSISYGNVLWVDGKNVPLTGYSAPYAMFHSTNDLYSLEKWNVSNSVSLGYENQLKTRFALRFTFSTAKLYTGILMRDDLITNDKSTINQIGIYSRYSLTKNLHHRIQFQWLAGPEVIYVKKNVLVEQYMQNETSDPANYQQDIDIVEGAVVTGLGVSLRLNNSFSLFSDGMAGIALPGGGLKITNSGLGLKVSW